MATENKYTESRTFREAISRAEGVLKDKTRLKSLLNATAEKEGDLDSAKKKYRTFTTQIRTAIRMIKAYAKGHYKEVPWRTLLSMVAGLLYFIMPFDMIPDFIPIAGFVDDISVVLWIFNRFQKDVQDFENWETRGVKVEVTPPEVKN